MRKCRKCHEVIATTTTTTTNPTSQITLFTSMHPGILNPNESQCGLLNLIQLKRKETSSIRGFRVRFSALCISSDGSLALHFPHGIVGKKKPANHSISCASLDAQAEPIYYTNGPHVASPKHLTTITFLSVLLAIPLEHRPNSRDEKLSSDVQIH